MRHDPSPASTREERFPRGLVIRLCVYLFTGHALVGFLYLLFAIGGRQYGPGRRIVVL